MLPQGNRKIVIRPGPGAIRLCWSRSWPLAAHWTNPRSEIPLSRPDHGQGGSCAPSAPGSGCAGLRTFSQTPTPPGTVPVLRRRSIGAPLSVREGLRPSAAAEPRNHVKMGRATVVGDARRDRALSMGTDGTLSGPEHATAGTNVKGQMADTLTAISRRRAPSALANPICNFANGLLDGPEQGRATLSPSTHDPHRAKQYREKKAEGQEPTDRSCSEAVVAHSMRGSGYKPIQNTTRVQTTRTAPMPIGMLTGSASVSRSPKYMTRTTLT